MVSATRARLFHLHEHEHGGFPIAITAFVFDPPYRVICRQFYSLNGAPNQSAEALAAFDNPIQLCHPATEATHDSGVIELLNRNADPRR